MFQYRQPQSALIPPTAPIPKPLRSPFPVPVQSGCRLRPACLTLAGVLHTTCQCQPKIFTSFSRVLRSIRERVAYNTKWRKMLRMCFCFSFFFVSFLVFVGYGYWKCAANFDNGQQRSEGEGTDFTLWTNRLLIKYPWTVAFICCSFLRVEGYR